MAPRWKPKLDRFLTAFGDLEVFRWLKFLVSDAPIASVQAISPVLLQTALEAPGMVGTAGVRT